jgi:formylmethanofuran:tetrahydromethanopterin formyltransferase
MGRSNLNCPSIADRTMTVTANESVSDIMAGAMTNATGAGVCTSSAESGCSATVSCSDTSDGLVQLYATFRFDYNMVNGTEIENVPLPDAGLLLNCTYIVITTPN